MIGEKDDDWWEPGEEMRGGGEMGDTYEGYSLECGKLEEGLSPKAQILNGFFST